MDWDNALRTKAAGRKFQPASSGGPQRAGQPGYGAGSIPYAPGATDYTPNTEPPRGATPAAPQFPQGAGGPSQPSMPQQGPSSPPNGASPQLDPLRALEVARLLYDRFRAARTQGGVNYRG